MEFAENAALTEYESESVSITEPSDDISGTDVYVGDSFNSIANFVILIIVFLLAKVVFKRFLLASRKDINPESENFAYSISVFSLFISLSIILTSVIYGNLPTTLSESILKLLTYSGLGIILLIASGFIFDKIALTRITLNKEIASGNIAAALVDAGNFIASALVIAAALKWYEFKHSEGILAILIMYVASQVILTLATIIRKVLFNYSDESINFEQQIAGRNNAAAIDFAGRRIATALAITAATNLIPYQEGYSLTDIMTKWVVISIITVAGLNVLSWCASKIIFWDRDIQMDIINRNSSTALGDAAVFVSFGIILAGTLM